MDSETQGYGYCIKCWINAGALCTPCFMEEVIKEKERDKERDKEHDKERDKERNKELKK